MTTPKWTRLSRREVLATPYYTLAHDRYTLPDGAVGDYHYIDIPGSAMVVPRLPSGELVLVRQHRYLLSRQSLEFPAGGMKRGSEPLETARAELREEAGFQAARWEAIGAFAPYNGVSNEICRIYLASGLSPVEARPDATEELEVLTCSREAVRDGIRRGEIWDGMTISAFFLFELAQF